MGNTISWQETADMSLAHLAIALQPQHRASLDKWKCFALACLLRQQLEKQPGMVVEAAILSDLIERMGLKLESEPHTPATFGPSRLFVVPA